MVINGWLMMINVGKPMPFLPAMTGNGLSYTTYIYGWWFGTWLLFFHILGIIIPTD